MSTARTTPSTQLEAPFLELVDAVVVRAGVPNLSIDSLRIAAGEHLALLGPNGSGKSTFVKLITREMLPLHREQPPVRFKGRPRATLAEVKQSLGIVSSTMQDQITVHLPVVDVVAGGLFGTLGIPRQVSDADADGPRARAHKALLLLGINDLAERDVMTLSTGQARRVLIARALVHDPDTLVFDEPCTGLDPEGMYYVRSSMRQLAQRGTGIILVTHYPEDVIPEIKRIVLLKEGAVFADGPKDQLLTGQVMSELFEVPLHVRRTVGGWERPTHGPDAPPPPDGEGVAAAARSDNEPENAAPPVKPRENAASPAKPCEEDAAARGDVAAPANFPAPPGESAALPTKPCDDAGTSRNLPEPPSENAASPANSPAPACENDDAHGEEYFSLVSVY